MTTDELGAKLDRMVQERGDSGFDFEHVNRLREKHGLPPAQKVDAVNNCVDNPPNDCTA